MTCSITLIILFTKGEELLLFSFPLDNKYYPVHVLLPANHLCYIKTCKTPGSSMEVLVGEHHLKLTRCRTKPFQLSSKSVCCITQNLTWEPHKIAKTQKFFFSLSECTHHLIFGSGTAEHWMDNVSSWPSSTSLFMRPFGKRGLSRSKNQNWRKFPKLTKLYVSWHPNKV